jgi:hypothetical protein
MHHIEKSIKKTKRTTETKDAGNLQFTVGGGKERNARVNPE